MHVVLASSVLDRFAEPVDHVDAELDQRADVVVGRGKTVARRVVRVGGRVREDAVDVDGVFVIVAGVVQAGDLGADRGERLAEVVGATAYPGAAVDATEGTKAAEPPSGVHRETRQRVQSVHPIRFPGWLLAGPR